MDVSPRPRRRLRTLGTLMGVVAVLAVAFAVYRPYTSPVIRSAIRVLRVNAPKLGPGFNPDHYLANSATLMPSGYWQVHFVRVAGPGAPELSVMVPDPGLKNRPTFSPSKGAAPSLTSQQTSR